MTDDKLKALLTLVVAINGWYVSEDNIVQAGELVKRGWASCSDDCEGPQLDRTEKGIRAAKRFGLVKEDNEGPYAHGWARTEAGLALTK